MEIMTFKKKSQCSLNFLLFGSIIYNSWGAEIFFMRNIYFVTPWTPPPGMATPLPSPSPTKTIYSVGRNLTGRFFFIFQTVHTARVPTLHDCSQHNKAFTTRSFLYKSVLLTMSIMMLETC